MQSGRPQKAGCHHCPPQPGASVQPLLSPAAGAMRRLAAQLEPSPVTVVVLHLRPFFLGMEGPPLFLGEVWVDKRAGTICAAVSMQ